MIHLLIAIVVVVLFLILELGGAATDILTINNQISRKALAGYLLAILIIYLVFNLMIRQI
ncbi:MAG TPA: hypothetical protein VND64_01625 [Pirellulales bacterium]|nr:hypothetical protein [Pirellulales bacterium]